MSASSSSRPPFRIRKGLTLWLGLALTSWSVAQSYAFLLGEISFPILLLFIIPSQYMTCVCIHDAVHGVISNSKKLNTLAGFLLACGVLLPFSLLRAAHLRHHRFLHDSHNDPEHIIYSASLPQLIARLPLIPFYYLSNWRLLDASSRRMTLASGATILAIATAIASYWGVINLLLAWIIPSIITIAWFGFTTVYVPHSRYQDTLMRFMNTHSGWHHDHHLAPHYPYHQYPQLRAFHLQHELLPSSSFEQWVFRTLSTPLWGAKALYKTDPSTSSPHQTHHAEPTDIARHPEELQASRH